MWVGLLYFDIISSVKIERERKTCTGKSYKIYRADWQKKETGQHETRYDSIIATNFRATSVSCDFVFQSVCL